MDGGGTLRFDPTDKRVDVLENGSKFTERGEDDIIFLGGMDANGVGRKKVR